ncbi:RNA-directed DNA polymerase, eukaryota, reverse transcriptase zinc-binding domain protein [Tanacetum coccineum]
MMGNLNRFTVQSLWYNSSFDFVCKNSLGKSGGILAVWDTTYFTLTDTMNGEGFLALLGTWRNLEAPCLLVLVYAPQDHHEKQILWNNLSQLIANYNNFSILLGDFNEVRFQSDCMGTVFDSRSASKFNNFIHYSGLSDLPLGGKWFTRMNNLGSNHNKIDRFLVSNHVIQKWPNSYVLALTREFSDHSPILLRNTSLDFGPIPFKIYNSWIEHVDFPIIVQESWVSSTSGPPDMLRAKIDCLDNKAKISPLSPYEVDSRTSFVKQLADLEHHKVRDLKQKAKIRWATEVNGSQTRRLLKTISSPLLATDSRNKIVLGLFSLVADSNILPQMRPDGFTFKFFKKHWTTIEHDVISYVRHIEVSGLIPRGCNSSFITLVPKVDDPLVVGEFRPISLIGCQYKIISKILANRLSQVVSSEVSDVQMAYIKNRQIIDGPLMVDEIIAWAKKHKGRLMFLKVDFEKAFDLLRWSFLFSVLEQMGFSSKWRNWIHSCLKSAFASVLANGSPTNEFKIEKGLRQGDPLSPFLFILAVEALNVALIEATSCDNP